MNEIEEIFIGKRLGFGAFRDVYAFKGDDTKVVKVANDQGRAANLLEDKIWTEISHTPVAKWFAPVLRVSEAGKYLIQERAEMLPHDKYPKEIPAFFTDTKYDNFGYIKGRGFVCVDFGTFNMFKGISTKMKKAQWW